MKVAVLGAGVVGVTTAYYLARDGHEVTVVDRNPQAAEETSYGNAGLVSPGDSYAWASPAALRLFMASLVKPGLGIKVRPQLDPTFLAWTVRFLFECTHARARINTLRKLRIALYAREKIAEVAEATGIAFDRRSSGILYYYRDQKSLDAGARHMALLAENGLAVEVVDRERLLRLEPALAGAGGEIAGGIYSPMDETGDCCLFARRLAAWCEAEAGVQFVWDSAIEGFETEGRTVKAVKTRNGPIAADAFVLAAGSDSPLLAKKLGISLPICPVKGYSLTYTIPSGVEGPLLGGVDEDRLIAYSRLGDRLRLAATAEFAGYDLSHRPADFARLLAFAADVFPAHTAGARPEEWAGLRPMTPTSVPILGPVPGSNLHLNTGHGHVGWTMACGTAKFVADRLAGRTPEIDPEGLGLAG
jgi:D-amino-acid dehydrogenase